MTLYHSNFRWTQIHVVVHPKKDTIEFVSEDDTAADHITYVRNSYSPH